VGLTITLGLDPHPGSHTVAALDENGLPLASLTVPNTPEGLGQLHSFAQSYEPRTWAIEGAGNRFVAAFVAELLAKSERVVNVPPSYTSQYRSKRGRKKNDVVDAQNVARALLANPSLPALSATERRQHLVDLTRTQRRLSRQLRSNRAALAEQQADSPVREPLEQVIDVFERQLAGIERQLRALVHHQPIFRG